MLVYCRFLQNLATWPKQQSIGGNPTEGLSVKNRYDKEMMLQYRFYIRVMTSRAASYSKEPGRARPRGASRGIRPAGKPRRMHRSPTGLHFRNRLGTCVQCTVGRKNTGVLYVTSTAVPET